MLFQVRDALTQANVGLTALQSDARLVPAEQALCGEVVQANTLALNALRADGTVVPGQRTARYQNIYDKVMAAAAVQAAHEAEFTPPEFYNWLDMSMDAAVAIRDGFPTFEAAY